MPTSSSTSSSTFSSTFSSTSRPPLTVVITIFSWWLFNLRLILPRPTLSLASTVKPVPGHQERSFVKGGEPIVTQDKIMIIIFWSYFDLQVFATLCTLFIHPICIKAPNPIGNIRLHGLMGSWRIEGGANSLKMVASAAQMKIASLFAPQQSIQGSGIPESKTTQDFRSKLPCLLWALDRMMIFFVNIRTKPAFCLLVTRLAGTRD